MVQPCCAVCASRAVPPLAQSGIPRASPPPQQMYASTHTTASFTRTWLRLQLQEAARRARAGHDMPAGLGGRGRRGRPAHDVAAQEGLRHLRLRRVHGLPGRAPARSDAPANAKFSLGRGAPPTRPHPPAVTRQQGKTQPRPRSTAYPAAPTRSDSPAKQKELYGHPCKPVMHVATTHDGVCRARVPAASL